MLYIKFRLCFNYLAKILTRKFPISLNGLSFRTYCVLCANWLKHPKSFRSWAQIKSGCDSHLIKYISLCEAGRYNVLCPLIQRARSTLSNGACDIYHIVSCIFPEVVSVSNIMDFLIVWPSVFCYWQPIAVLLRLVFHMSSVGVANGSLQSSSSSSHSAMGATDVLPYPRRRSSVQVGTKTLAKTKSI